jgi:hypothetical protein
MIEHLVEIEFGDETYSFLVSQASVLDGIERAVIRGTASNFVDTIMKSDGKDIDDESALKLLPKFTAMRIAAEGMYPDLIAATKEATGIDLDNFGIAEFIGMPDAVMTPWSDAVYRLNPHWLPDFGRTKEGDEGKVSENDSKNGEED